MARQIPLSSVYDPEEEEEYVPKSGRSHGRNYALARPDPRSTMNHSRPLSTSGQSASNSGNNTSSSSGPPRRRIPVACGRCRKRKIRCSGDSTGQGCENCKAAHIQPGGCMFLRAGSSNVDLHPYATVGASASTPSLSLGLYEPMASSHHLPGQQIRPSHSTTSLIPGFHNGVNEIISLKPLYPGETPNGNSSQESRNGLILGSANSLGGDMNNPGENNGGVYEGGFPQYLLPDIGHGVMQQDPLRQWTPLSMAGHRSNVYLDQESGQSYVSNPRVSPGSLDAYGPPNMFPALTNLSDNLPSTTGTTSTQPYARGEPGYASKQSEKITLPTIQGYARSQSLDMNTLSTRSTTSSGLTDPPPPYQYKGYSWGAEPSLSAPPPTYTFAPMRPRQLNVGSSHYSQEAASRSSQPMLQSPSTLSAHITTSRAGTNYSTGYSSSMSTSYPNQSHPLFPLSSSNSADHNSPATASTLPSLEGDKKSVKRDCGNGDAFKGASSDSTGSSVPASPYSSSPTSSLYGTSRSQPPTPAPARSASDKGLSTHSSSQRRGHLNKIY